MTQKKTERLDVRISHQKKRAFNAACETQSDTPSQAIRRFVNSYIRRANRDETAGRLRSLLPKHSSKIAVAVVMGLLSLALLKSTILNKTELFAYYDSDGSGLIDAGEISHNDEHLHRVLDIDGQRGISPTEFLPKGTMVWQFVEPSTTYNVKIKKWGIFGKTIAEKPSSFDVDKLPDGTMLIPKDDPESFISVETYKARKMTSEDLQSLDYQALRASGLSASSKYKGEEEETMNHFVIFDLTDLDRPQINVLQQTSTAPYSKSMSYSRSVDWVEGHEVPHFIFGKGAYTFATAQANLE